MKPVDLIPVLDLMTRQTRMVLEPTEILPATIPGTYGGITRRPQKDCKTVIEPTEVLAPGSAPSGGEQPVFRTWHPNVFMRRLGYTMNPDICRHSKKAYQPSFGWWCRDCGDSLPRG